MRKVYIFGSPANDYSDAHRYGELHFISIPERAKWDISHLHELLQEEMGLAEADDLFIIGGLASVCCVATAVMVEWYGRVNFLIYKNDRYVERRIVTNQEVGNG